MNQKKLKSAVLKVALGYSLEEVTEEYGVEDGELKLVRRRETRKDVPPDLKAVKLLLEETAAPKMTDEELEAEKTRLLKELKELYDDGTEGSGAGTGTGAQGGAR